MSQWILGSEFLFSNKEFSYYKHITKTKFYYVEISRTSNVYSKISREYLLKVYDATMNEFKHNMETLDE